MKRAEELLANRASGLILAGMVLFVASPRARAQEVQHLSITVPGGMPGMPIFTGITKTTNGVKLTWDGPSGYCQLLARTNVDGGVWQNVGGPNATRTATITNVHGNAFFRISGPAPHYVGSQACIECHGGIHDTEVRTAHVGAFTNTMFAAAGGQTNSSCLPCHTVGFKLPTGFVITNRNGVLSYTTNLAGVQCENCHGPAGNHAATEYDFTVRPRAEVAATVCGGCHTGPENPTFDEWKTSGHANVTEPDMNPDSCGRCHIGSARIAMLKGDPVPQNDSDVGVVCGVCHDPHRVSVFTNAVTGSVYTNQLRNPLTSTNDYFLTTSDVFTNKYNPYVNVCAQCHNHRGADWQTTRSAPHHSAQYNFLLATVGLVPAGVGYGPATHAGTRFVTDQSGRMLLVTNQCVTCHMQTKAHQYGPPEVAAVTGHEFEVNSYGACADCHGSAANAGGLVELVTEIISDRIQDVKNELDGWAATKAPASLWTKYGTRAWEYSTPGDLSPGGPGPTTDEQAQIPDNIKKARFNLYVVLYDGSYGVHNRPYAQTLLDAAEGWVNEELAK